MSPARLILAVFVLISVTSSSPGAPPGFAKDVRPFLAKYCTECHNADKPKGEFDLTTFQALMGGGKHGPTVVPGKPDNSRLVTTVEHKTKPVMPPKKARQPRAEEIGVLRAWVAAGARDDSAAVTVALPAIPAKTVALPPVTALAYSPDGKLLAASGNREAWLFDTSTHTLSARLPGQTNAVTALAFSPDGKHLVVASGTAGSVGEARLYDIVNGQVAPQPRHTLAVHADIVYAVAFSPNSQTLATTGYDRLIKVWDVDGGKLLRTLKDHSDTVYGLAFSPDGKLLASAAADRAVKIWDTASGVRLYSLGDATDWLYAVAWSSDGRHLAAAGVDKSIRVWEVDARGGKLIRSVFAHEGPVVRLAYSADGQTLYSLGEDRLLKSWDAARMAERKIYAKQPEAALSLAVRPDRKHLAVGRYDGHLLVLEEASGKVDAEPLPAKTGDRFPPASEIEPNDSPKTGQFVKLPVSLAGRLDRAGDVDFYRFEAKAGQQVGVQVVSSAKDFDPVLQWIDPAGRVLAESDNGLLGHACEKAGTYALGLRDRNYRGGAHPYRLHIGDIPIITGVFPLGARRGAETIVRLDGVHLGSTNSVRVQVPADAVPGSRIPLTVAGNPLGKPAVVVGEFPEMSHPAGNAVLAVPGTANGLVERAGASEIWRFSAKKGQRLIVEIHARRLGSPLDSTIEILDAQGKPLPRATLRCVAKTFTTFRDHDSISSGIRLETWNELAVNDYLLAGGELLRIRDLPKNPDDDCQFFAVAGRRLGYLGTTPTHHANGSPMYKVTIHPPGATFPSNGMPIIPIYYRNDDGGPGHDKDSMLFFDPPADGEYQVRVADSRGSGSSRHAYRLTIRPPRPAFQVRFAPTEPAVWKGGALPITVTADRLDGFDGSIAVRLENLPPGFSAPPTTIPAGEYSTSFALYAEPTAGAGTSPIKLLARATIAGKEMEREVTGSIPKAVPPGDLTTVTEQAEATVQPGQTTRLTVRIERRNGFVGRVPLDVRGLPHGVRVLDIGLNGILVLPGETARTIEIFCEPWVQPTEQPFVVFARREGKNTQHAAKSVLLRVTPKQTREPIP